MESLTCGKTPISYQASRVLSRIPSLGGGGGGRGVDPKNVFRAAQRGEKFFTPSRGIRGHAVPENFEKIVFSIG